MADGLSLAIAIELFNVILAGALFIITYRVYTFFRKLEVARPLIIVGCGFYAYFVHTVVKILQDAFSATVPYLFEITEVAFIVIAIYGVVGFSQAFSIYNRNRTEIELTALKIERKSKLDALRDKKQQVENDLKMIKYRYMKREIDSQIFNSLLAEKEQEYSEVKARLAELSGR
jgi:hypothetical protein